MPLIAVGNVSNGNIVPEKNNINEPIEIAPSVDVSSDLKI